MSETMMAEPQVTDTVRGLDQQIEQQPMVDFAVMREALGQQVEQVQKQFRVKHRHLLRWAAKQGYDLPFLAQDIGRAMAVGGLMLSMLTSAPQAVVGLPRAPSAEPVVAHSSQLTEQQVRAKHLETVRAAQARQALEQQELQKQILAESQQQAYSVDPAVNDEVAKMVASLTTVQTVAQMDGYRLQTSIGRIGAEQHLKRFPGDTLVGHGSGAGGMAPGLGAYGYFASSQSTLTAEAAAREQYYVAVQTFLSPNWPGHVQATYNWFKYRKVLVYHPVTGQAVVAVVADAGPSQSTGKAFGGSPEVMAALGAHDGYGTPPVVLLFVDDPNNQVPLGPVHFQVSLPDSPKGGL